MYVMSTTCAVLPILLSLFRRIVHHLASHKISTPVYLEQQLTWIRLWLHYGLTLRRLKGHFSRIVLNGAIR